MWFDIIKDNKRTQYYREFLEEVKDLEVIIDSPDNIKKYEVMSGEDRPQYGENTSFATLVTTGVNYFKITCRVSLRDPWMTISKVGDMGYGNKQYNNFLVRMFKNEYPELYNKIWDFALFYNKIVNPTLLGKEADKQRALFAGSRNPVGLLKSNLGVIYDFIHNFLFNIKTKTFRLPDKDIYSRLNPTTTLVPRKDFIDRLTTFPRIHDAHETSTSFALKTVLNRTHLYTVTDYIMENWVSLINTLRTDDPFNDAPNIKTTKLKYISAQATEFQNHWYSHYHEVHEEEIKENIKEIENIPEEDLGNWEDGDDDDDDEQGDIDALFA